MSKFYSLIFAVGLLLGVGVINSHAQEVKEAVEKVVDKTKDVAEKVVDKTKDVGDKIADKSKDAAKKAAKETKKSAKKAADKTRDGVEEVADKAEDAKDKSVSTTRKVVGPIPQVGTTVGEKTWDGTKWVSSKTWKGG